MGREDEEWLRRLVAAAKPAELLMPIGTISDADDEPIATFDSAVGSWRAGRYVGEIQFDGGTLRIEPRFGMSTLMRWLGAIWGVRLVESKGAIRDQRLWLWLVIAHLWSGRVIAAAKHGLPFRRLDTIHEGRALRGKLLARDTALARVMGDDRLVSLTRVRVVDPIIGGIILAAFRRLTEALGGHGDRATWLPEQGQTIIEDLRAALGSRYGAQLARGHATVRYTPITEGFRSAVDLSMAILSQRPRAPTAGGEAKAYGILLDMAEIWELYVAKLIHIGLPGLRVFHTGRTTQHFRWLLSGPDDETLGSLRPDILILDAEDRCLGIADAKYKTTRINARNTTGVLREDLYQLTAYLSGFGDPAQKLDGFLIYPDDPEGEIARRLSPKSPWKVTSAHQRNLWFVAAEGGASADGQTLTQAERIITERVRDVILSGLSHRLNVSA